MFLKLSLFLVLHLCVSQSFAEHASSKKVIEVGGARPTLAPEPAPSPTVSGLKRLPCVYEKQGRVMCGIGSKNACNNVKGVQFLSHNSCKDPFVRQFWPGRTGACVQVNRRGERMACRDQMQIWEANNGAMMTGLGNFPAIDRACYNGQMRINFDAYKSPVAMLVGKKCSEVPKILSKVDLASVGVPHHPGYSLQVENFQRFLLGLRAKAANGKILP